MADFELIDHTADIGLVARGKSLEEAFEGAAYGMFTLITDLDGVEERLSCQVKVQAPDDEALLVAWLNELIYLFEVERLLLKRFLVRELAGGRLRAEAWGEALDPSRHHLKSGVKAATYHMLKVERDNGFRVQVILDV